MNLFDINGRRAIVTGGSDGLGHGMAEGLLESGAEVCIVGHSEKGANAVREWCEKGYKAHFVQGDLGKREELDRIFAACMEKLGDLDILINCAGIQRRASSEVFPMEYWDDVIAVNLTAVFRLCQLAANVMLPKGYGKIINIASMMTFFGGQTIPAYAASKGGVAQMTRCLSNDLAGRGLNINCIAPGYMETAMNERLLNDPKRLKEISDRIPQHRWGTPDDMKGAAIFLASHASDYLNGAIIPVDGGYLGK